MKRVIGILSLAACLAGSGAAHASTTFNIQLDNEGFTLGDGPLVPPIIGTGTFTSPVDLQPGTYALPTLPGFLLTFNIDGDSYDQTDITTPLSGVAVQIVQSGGQERLFFTESTGAGQDGGPHAGALDLDDPVTNTYVSFEPTSQGGNFLYKEGLESQPFGNVSGRYLALSPSRTLLPEPSALALLATGIGMLLLRPRRSRPG